MDDITLFCTYDIQYFFKYYIGLQSAQIKISLRRARCFICYKQWVSDYWEIGKTENISEKF